MSGNRILPVWIVWVISAFPAFGGYPYCTEFSCDSAVVRHILELNGRREVKVSDVVRIGDGRITGLSMQYLGLDTLPPELGHLSALTHLGIDRNELREIPGAIGQLTSLVSLLLDNNRLASLPPEIGKLDSLQRLIVFSNFLESVPPEIGRLAALKNLRLDGNRISELPSTFLALAPTEGLDVQNNRLCNISFSAEKWIDRYSADRGWKDSQTADGINVCPVSFISKRTRNSDSKREFRKLTIAHTVIFAASAKRESQFYGLRGDRIDVRQGHP